MVLVRRARRVGTNRESRACPERRYDAQVKFVVALVILSDALRSRVTRSPGLVLIGDRSSEGSQDAFEIMPIFAIDVGSHQRKAAFQSAWQRIGFRH